MLSNSEVLKGIAAVLEMDTDRPNTGVGYFTSLKDQAYKNEAIRQIFSGLKRENQNKVLEFAAQILYIQNCGSELALPVTGGQA